jgi:hypothetical protein
MYINYSKKVGSELSATMAGLCEKTAMSAAVTSLRIICSLCTLKGERIGATDHIVFKNRIIKQCMSSILKVSFSLFHSSFLSSSSSSSTTSTTTIRTRLKWFRNFSL